MPTGIPGLRHCCDVTQWFHSHCDPGIPGLRHCCDVTGVITYLGEVCEDSAVGFSVQDGGISRVDCPGRRGRHMWSHASAWLVT